MNVMKCYSYNREPLSGMARSDMGKTVMQERELRFQRKKVLVDTVGPRPKQTLPGKHKFPLPEMICRQRRRNMLRRARKINCESFIRCRFWLSVGLKK